MVPTSAPSFSTQELFRVTDISQVLEIAKERIDHCSTSVFMDFDRTTAFLKDEEIEYEELQLWASKNCSPTVNWTICKWALDIFPAHFVEGEKTRETILHLMKKAKSFIWLSKRSSVIYDLTLKHIKQLNLPLGTITSSSPHGFILTGRLSKGIALKEFFLQEHGAKKTDVVLHIDDNPNDVREVFLACQEMQRPALVFHYIHPIPIFRNLSHAQVTKLFEKYSLHLEADPDDLA